MSDRIRFLADAHIDVDLIRGLQRVQPAIDFQTAEAAGLRGVPDPEVLRIAAENNRLLVTYDKRTMPKHFGDFLEAGQHSPGILILRPFLTFHEAIEKLHLIWELGTPEEWRDRLIFMP